MSESARRCRINGTECPTCFFVIARGKIAKSHSFRAQCQSVDPIRSIRISDSSERDRTASQSVIQIPVGVLYRGRIYRFYTFEKIRSVWTLDCNSNTAKRWSFRIVQSQLQPLYRTQLITFYANFDVAVRLIYRYAVRHAQFGHLSIVFDSTVLAVQQKRRAARLPHASFGQMANQRPELNQQSQRPQDRHWLIER